MLPALVVPGYGGSALPHWQRLWAASDPAVSVVEQADWDRPDLEAWVGVLEGAVVAAGPCVLAAHSLGGLAVVHWASRRPRGRVLGALLVAPTDAEAPGFAVPATGFVPIPLSPLPFPSVVAASTNDPVVTPSRARAFADAWGSRFVDLGACGHVDAEDGLGPWPRGRALLGELRAAG